MHLLAIRLFQKPNHEDLGQQEDEYELHVIAMTAFWCGVTKCSEGPPPTAPEDGDVTKPVECSFQGLAREQ